MSIPSVRLHLSAPAALERVRVVLVNTSHPGNVGSCARAMRVMGLRQLVLVAPRFEDVCRHPDALAFASGAPDVLQRAWVVPTLEQALSEVTLAVAVSADAREIGPPLQPPRIAMQAVWQEVGGSPRHRAALVFGSERHGLSIDDARRCQLLCSIPGEPDYNSLNLAQAVQVLAYVLREQAMEDRSPPEAPARMASQEQIERMHEHLERALIDIGFLDPAHPRKLMPRLRRLFGRVRLEQEEVDLLRGICSQILSGRRGLVGVRKASDPGDASRGDPP